MTINTFTVKAVHRNQQLVAIDTNVCDSSTKIKHLVCNFSQLFDQFCANGRAQIVLKILETRVLRWEGKSSAGGLEAQPSRR